MPQLITSSTYLSISKHIVPQRFRSYKSVGTEWSTVHNTGWQHHSGTPSVCLVCVAGVRCSHSEASKWLEGMEQASKPGGYTYREVET